MGADSVRALAPGLRRCHSGSGSGSVATRLADLLEDILVAAQTATAGLQVAKLEAERADAVEHIFWPGDLERVSANPVNEVMSRRHPSHPDGPRFARGSALAEPHHGTHWPAPC